MANKTTVRINHEDKIIIVTKEYAKKASIPGSAKYKELLSLKRENGGYSVVVVKNTPKRNTGINKITLASMRAYISKHDDEEGTKMRKFESMVHEEAGENLQKTSFFAIRNWFFEQYPELKETVA